MRQAVWDVTGYVAAAGAGHLHRRRHRPRAVRRLAAVRVVGDRRRLRARSRQRRPRRRCRAEQQPRFAPRAISWHDGFVVRAEGSIDVPVAGFAGRGRPADVRQELPPRRPRPALAAPTTCSSTVGPLGNNADAGRRAAAGRRGRRRRPGAATARPTSSTTRSACSASPVATKAPGPADYRASGDGMTPTSGLGRRHRRHPHPRPLLPARLDVGDAEPAGDRRPRWRPACSPCPSTCRRCRSAVDPVGDLDRRRAVRRLVALAAVGHAGARRRLGCGRGRARAAARLLGAARTPTADACVEPAPAAPVEPVASDDVAADDRAGRPPTPATDRRPTAPDRRPRRPTDHDDVDPATTTTTTLDPARTTTTVDPTDDDDHRRPGRDHDDHRRPERDHDDRRRSQRHDDRPCRRRRPRTSTPIPSLPPVEAPGGRVVLPAGAVDTGQIRPITFPVAGPVTLRQRLGRLPRRLRPGAQGQRPDRRPPAAAPRHARRRRRPPARPPDGRLRRRHPRRRGVGVPRVPREQRHARAPTTAPTTARGGSLPGIVPGARVTAGQLLGWMGDSGNSEGSVPHAHVEIHRPDGAAINPYWSLRQAQRDVNCAVGTVGPADGPAAAGVADRRPTGSGPTLAARRRRPRHRSAAAAAAAGVAGDRLGGGDAAGRLAAAHGHRRQPGSASRRPDVDQPRRLHAGRRRRPARRRPPLRRRRRLHASRSSRSCRRRSRPSSARSWRRSGRWSRAATTRCR